MTVGSKIGMAGNAVPSDAESEIRQVSTGVDILTLTLNSSVSSTTGGLPLVVRRHNKEGTSGGAGDLLAVEYDGQRGRRHIVALSSASTAITVSASQSGAFVVVPGMTSGTTLTLPAMDAGLWYEFYVAALTASGGIAIAAATAGDMVFYNEAAGNSINLGVASGTSIGGSLRVHTDGTKWYSIMQPAYSSAAPATATMTLYNLTS